MKDFKTLKVWLKAHRFSLHVYQATRHFPKYERFGLTVQLRRSAVSIPSNIAEGCGRIGEKEFARFLGIALGSASEAEYRAHSAHDLNYPSDTCAEQYFCLPYADSYDKVDQSNREISDQANA